MVTIDAKEAYELGAEHQFDVDLIKLGPWSSYSLIHDPKHLSFVLSRYKFVAKMLVGTKSVMEVGCGDGFGIPIIAQACGQVHCVDWEQRHMDENPKRMPHLKNVTYERVDMTEAQPSVQVDAAFSIDVLEHLNPKDEKIFMDHTVACLTDNGVLVTGTPNVTAEEHASERSRVQHINLKSMEELRQLHLKYFDNVFMFGMNDEVLHTGFAPMCHYIWAVAAGLKPQYRKSV